MLRPVPSGPATLGDGRADGVDRRFAGLAPAAWAGAFFAAFLALASRTGPGTPFAPSEPIAAFAVGMLPALLWLAFAAGVGVPFARLLPGHLSTAERRLCTVAIGVGVAMTLDAALGRLGLLAAGRGVVAWLLAIGGLSVLLVALRRVKPEMPRLPWPSLAVVPAAATLAVASLAAPGWLWASEFGGYDALSYHLQLPKEWLAGGSIEPLAHNVYSHLPSHVEASTLHLMAMLRDPLDAAIPAQCLQALLAVLTALLLAATSTRLAGSAAGLVAAGAWLGTPWVVVTGSLAYNEMAVCLPLAAGLAILLRPRDEPSARDRSVLAVAILAATAVGAKATAIGFVAAPLAAILFVESPRRALRSAFAMVAVAVAILSPWLVHNAIAAGQPFFPLFATVLGGGGWSEAQAAIFAAAHGPDASPLVAFLDEALRHGIGPAPQEGEPWRPQWSLLWPLGLAAIAMLFACASHRAAAARLALALGLMLLFWGGFTHLESRFLVPAAVPLSLGLGIAASGLASRLDRSLAAIAVAVWSLVPAAIFLRERPIEPQDRWGTPAAATGRVSALAGDLHIRLLRDPGLSRAERGAILETAPPWTFLNDPSLAGMSGKVLLVGEARPFYLRRPGEYATVWDRGRLSRLAEEHPGDPDRWRRELSAAGFSLVLVDRNMIERWRRDGWWDPALDAASLDGFLERLVLLRRFAYGLELHAIREPATP